MPQLFLAEKFLRTVNPSQFIVKNSSTVLAVGLLSVMPLTVSALPSALNPNDFTEAFYDDFTYTDASNQPALNPLYWNIEDDDTINNPNRGALMDPTAVVAGAGTVTLYTYTDSGTHYSGNINTTDKVHSNFGYYEAYIRWDQLHGGVAAAYWIMPGSTPGSDPATGQEIDIIELRNERRARFYSDGLANNSGTIIPLDDRLHFGLHWDGYNTHQNSLWGTVFPKGVGNTLVDGNFHKYGLLWTPDLYVVYFDDVEVFRAPKPYRAFDSNNPSSIPADVVDPLLPLPGSSGWYYEGDLSSTSSVDEGWLASDKDGYTSEVYYPSSGLVRNPTSAVKFSNEKAVSYAMSRVILSLEVRAPGNPSVHTEGQDGWVGDIPSGGYGALGTAANNKMTVDWVRYYSLNSLTGAQSASATNSIPGTIDATDYDNGGQGVAIFERDGSGSAGVDTGTYSGGDYVITDQREWLEYTLSTPQPGYYLMYLEMANPVSPTGLTNGEINDERSTIKASVGNVVIGSASVDLSTETAFADKLRRHLISDIPYLQSGDIINVEAVNNSQISLAGLHFDYLGNAVAFAEAEDGALTGVFSGNTDSYLTGFNAYDSNEAPDYVHGTATYTGLTLPNWDDEDATLFLAYSGAYNSNKNPNLTVEVNGNPITVDVAFDDPHFAIGGHEWNFYRIQTVAVPAAYLQSGGNTVEVIANNVNNQGLRLDWLCLGATVTLPPSSGMTVELEAEDAAVFGDSGNEAYYGTHANAHGPNNGYVDGLNKANAGLQWTNVQASTGTVQLVIHYATTGSGVTKTLEVNGTVVDDSVSFPATSGNNDFSGAVTVNGVTLAGSDTIKIYRDLSAPGSNTGSLRVDYIEIIGVVPVDETVEAETGSLFGDSGNEAYVGTHGNASNGAFVDGLNKMNAGATVSLPSVPAGQYDITLGYATTSLTCNKTVEVNGSVVNAALDFPATSANNDFSGTVTLSGVTLTGSGDTLTVWRDPAVSGSNPGSLRLDYIQVQN